MLRLTSVHRAVAKLAVLASALLSAAVWGGPLPTDLITHNEVIINASPATIWPYLIDKRELWKAGPRTALVSGDKEQRGARFNAYMPDNPDQTVFQLELVDVARERRYTSRLTMPDGTLIGFATWWLIPQGKATLVRYDVYSYVTLATESDKPSAEEAATLQTSYREMNHKRFDEEFAKLKQLVEAEQANSSKKK